MIRYAIGLFMTVAGLVHFAYPRVYGAILPDWAPWKRGLVFWSGVAEILIGVLLMMPATAKWAALALLILMICFLPLHVYHLFQPPVKLSYPYGVYVGRAVLQLAIIWGCWKMYALLSKGEA